MSELPDFQRMQYRFTAHVREPESHPVPDGIEERRMRVYRELLFNNTRGFLDSGFPVLRSLYSATAWERLARDFFARHRCRTPYFLEIAREFLAYLESEHEAAAEDPPFLLELAHYEWIELALSVADVEPAWETIDPGGDLLAGCPVRSPLAWLLSYRYPVHRIGPEHTPTAAPDTPTHLLVHRDRDDAVHFMELNAVTARLVALLGEDEDRNGRELLEQIAEELAHPNPDIVLHGGLEALESMRRRGAVLGTRRTA